MTNHHLPHGAPLDEGTEPDLLHYHPVSTADLKMVSALADRLRATGALDRLEASQGLTADMAFQDALREAVALSAPEEVSNPNFYRPEVEAIVAEREANEADWVNPSLDGVDDYGNQAYLDSEELTRLNRARIAAEEEEEAPWERFLGPGV